MMPHERRLNIRKPLDQIAYLSLPPNNGGVVQDVSEGGLGFHAIAPIEADGPIQFRFAINSAERIKAVGELAWIDGTRRVGGLRFTQLPDEVREQIRIWTGQPRADVLEVPVSPPVMEAEATSTGEADSVPVVDAPVAVPKIEAEAAPSSKSEPAPLRANGNPPVTSVKPSTYSGLSNKFSMFALDESSEEGTSADAVPQSVYARHPIAAVGVTIALAFFVSIGIFTYVSTSRAGEKLYFWSKMVLRRGYSQPIQSDTAPPMNAAHDASKSPQQ
jgi:hypothetical protein